MTDTSRLPFSPLTHRELNNRAESETLEAGYRARSVHRAGDTFQPYDLDFMSRAAAAAEEWHAASLARLPR